MKKMIRSSKKGFTLIELVVVIAILAIISAIAIPAVITLVDNAATTTSESSAATLNEACKEFYTGVVSGTITDDNKDWVTATLPKRGDSIITKKIKAKALKVQSAVEYSRLTGEFSDDAVLTGYQYSAINGTITYTEDPIDGVTQKPLSLTTTFAQLYKY